MSYILDALRKADAQRVRDPARGIHAQAPIASASAPETRVRRHHLFFGAAALLVLLAGLWLFAGGREPAQLPSPPVPAQQQVVIVQPPSPAAPATQVLPPAPPVSLVVAPAPAIPVAQVPQPAPPKAAPAPMPAPAAAADRVYAFTELPADVQQAFPKLSITGGVYSENISQRMLIVNGQVFNEGSEVAPGVVLEQLRPKSAVLKFRGLRVAQSY